MTEKLQIDWANVARPVVSRKSKAQIKRELREARLDTRSFKCCLCLAREDVQRWEWPKNRKLFMCSWCLGHYHVCGVHKPSPNDRSLVVDFGGNIRKAFVAYWMLCYEIRRVSRFNRTGKPQEPIRWDIQRKKQLEELNRIAKMQREIAAAR